MSVLRELPSYFHQRFPYSTLPNLPSAQLLNLPCCPIERIQRADLCRCGWVGGAAAVDFDTTPIFISRVRSGPKRLHAFATQFKHPFSGCEHSFPLSPAFLKSDCGWAPLRVLLVQVPYFLWGELPMYTLRKGMEALNPILKP